MTKIRSQGGFSLLEVLIALLVLSIGLLGLAALQTVGLKFNTQSYQRTQAVLNAYDIIDRIRANPGGMNGGNYDNVALTAPPPAITTDCGASQCSSADMATYDINQWKTSIQNLLSQGNGAICRGTLDLATLGCTPVAGTNFQVGIQWIENDLPMNMIVGAQL